MNLFICLSQNQHQQQPIISLALPYTLQQPTELYCFLRCLTFGEGEGDTEKQKRGAPEKFNGTERRH